MPPYRRPINMMFQSYALFPHLNVESNIAFGLKQERLPKGEIAARVAQMLALVRLEDYGKRRPHQLSGGERQRVALARSLAKRPRVLLLDEPAAGIPVGESAEIFGVLASLPRDVTILFIEHDMNLVFRFAERITVLVEGSILVEGAPEEIAANPRVREVYLGEGGHG